MACEAPDLGCCDDEQNANCGNCFNEGPTQLWIGDPLNFMGSTEDWCCGHPEPPNAPNGCGPLCGPGQAELPGLGSRLWDGRLVVNGNPCRYADNRILIGGTNLGGSPGRSNEAPGSYAAIKVDLICIASTPNRWVLQISSNNGSSFGCFTNWWRGEKFTGPDGAGSFTRVDGCSPHPASITVLSSAPTLAP